MPQMARSVPGVRDRDLSSRSPSGCSLHFWLTRLDEFPEWCDECSVAVMATNELEEEKPEIPAIFRPANSEILVFSTVFTFHGCTLICVHLRCAHP